MSFEYTYKRQSRLRQVEIAVLDRKTIVMVGITLLLGLAGYFGFIQYQRISSLESEKSTIDQQNKDLLSYTQNLNEALDETQSKEREYESKIDELSQSVNHYKAQANAATLQTQDLSQELSNSMSPPYTLIQERTVIWVFEDSQGNEYDWEMPIDTYRSTIESPEPKDMKYLEAEGGAKFTVRDYTKFVDSTSFKDVIGNLFDNAGSDQQFLYEVWFVASQLTTYSSDIDDDPRWALETFTEAGGDCEDLTILIASMLKASPHTDDWTIEMVYFDADSPDKPLDMNHVALFIKADDFQTYLEATAKADGLNYWESVNGWFYEV